MQAVPSPFSIIVDSRERLAYRFDTLEADAAQKYAPLAVAWEWGTLPAGDYSIKGLEGEIAVERKSLADLYSTLGQDRDRFEREHVKLAAIRSAHVVIEATLPEILASPPPQSKLLPKTVVRTILAWSERYRVRYWFTGDRQLSEVFTYRLLERFWRERQEPTE